MNGKPSFRFRRLPRNLHRPLALWLIRSHAECDHNQAHLSAVASAAYRLAVKANVSSLPNRLIFR